MRSNASRLIIKQLQRAHYGRRSERLDSDQFALGLEDLDSDLADPEAPPGNRRPAPPMHQATQAPARASAARRSGARPGGRDVPLLRRGGACDRRERQRDARLGAGAACACCASAARNMPAAHAEQSTRRPRPSGRSPRAAPRQPCWPMCWSASTATTCPSTDNRRSSPARGHLDRSTLANWVGGASWWLEALRERLAAHSSPRAISCSPTIRRSRCSIQVAGEPPGDYGYTCATPALGRAGPSGRRLLSTARTAGRTARRRI